MKSLIAAGLVLLALVGGFFWLNNYIYQEKQAVTSTDYKNAEYVIEGQRVKLENGRAETEAAPGSASKVVTQYFGNEAKGDLNGDGIVDIAFLLTQDGGGSGTFYYAVVALQSADNTYRGTNAVFLGDRIHPQSTSIMDGQLIVNYGERKMGEPMTAEVTVGVSKYLKVEQDTLIEVGSEPEWLISDTGAFNEFGAPLTMVALRVNGEQRAIGVYDGSCAVIEESQWQLMENEVSGVICWFAGGGKEIGVFREGEQFVVKEGDVDEGSAETEGFRGNFKALIAL